jgi:Mn2+/Fe2+ NRAMP family transporter
MRVGFERPPCKQPAPLEELQLPSMGLGSLPSLQQAPLEELQLPSMGLGSLLSHFGPGVVLMMTGIGTSHLVTAPTAGGRFEFALLWCLPVAFLFKYHGFEMAFRFTNATGKSLMEAYGTSWKKWPIWYVLVTTLVQCAVGQAGRLIAASAVVYYLFTETLRIPISLSGYGVVLGSISVTVILMGRYRAVEVASKVLAAVLVGSTIAVFLTNPPPLAAMGHFFHLEGPAGSWLLIAGLLGLLPTGIDVSLQVSEWGRAKREGVCRIRGNLEQAGLAGRFDPFAPRREDLTVQTDQMPQHLREYSRRWFEIGLMDYRLGYLVSFLTATVFLLLAAVWLYPSPVEGPAVMGEIAGIFTRSLGPGMMILFLMGAFAATFSTAFNYFDGWPRIVGACCRNLFRGTARLEGTDNSGVTPECRRTWYSEYNIYRATMIYSLVAAVAIIAGFPQPVFLVLVASALSLFISPVIYFLNLHYCLTVIPRDDSPFYPKRSERWFAWGSLVVFSGLTVVLLVAKIFGVALIGG